MKYHVWHDIGSVIKRKILHEKGAPPIEGTPQQQSTMEMSLSCRLFGNIID